MVTDVTSNQSEDDTSSDNFSPNSSLTILEANIDQSEDDTSSDDF